MFNYSSHMGIYLGIGSWLEMQLYIEWMHVYLSHMIVFSCISIGREVFTWIRRLNHHYDNQPLLLVVKRWWGRGIHLCEWGEELPRDVPIIGSAPKLYKLMRFIFNPKTQSHCRSSLQEYIFLWGIKVFSYFDPPCASLDCCFFFTVILWSIHCKNHKSSLPIQSVTS